MNLMSRDLMVQDLETLEKYKKLFEQEHTFRVEEFNEYKKLQAENAKLREALKNCPILGEVHRDSNDRFKEWNLEYKYILKELEEK